MIQTARDKAVEILKAFNKNKKENSVLSLKRISIRFDKRCSSFSKTTNVLTPYWLTLTLYGEKVSLPIMFGEKQKQMIEEALRNEGDKGKWKFTAVEMVKRNGEWHAHLVLKKTIAFNGPKTVIGIDIGEVNLATAIALTEHDKPSKGKFWRGSEIKRIRGLYNHIRRSLSGKKIKAIGAKEQRRVNHQLHIIANQIVGYAKQFPNPIIALEGLNGLRKHMKFSKKLNRRAHSMPYRKLQTYIEYKANLERIEVRYVKGKTSKACHRCGYVARMAGYQRELRCLHCGLIYNRDLNAAINIAHALKRGMGWGSVTPPNSQMRVNAQSFT